MKHSKLEIETVIKGIGGASGLYCEGDLIYLISDDSYVLYKYSRQSGRLHKINLLADSDLRENLPKPEKPDFESIARTGNSFFIFGSGSTELRTECFEMDRNSLTTEKISMKSLYSKMKEVSAISADDFNIEGVVIDKDSAFFFNRGNGPGNKNGIFRVNNWRQAGVQDIKFFPVQLPSNENSVYGFTDACLIDDVFYFVASAEAGGSTYLDGEVSGSGIGRISASDLGLIDFEIISSDYKFEGISPLKINSSNIEFLLCEDSDDHSGSSTILKLSVDN